MNINKNLSTNQEKQKPHKKNKLVVLNFNLKKEILSYLPVVQVINEIFNLNKKISFAVKKKKYFQIIEEQFEELLKISDFELTKMIHMGTILPSIGETLECTLQIAKYFLFRKFRDYEKFEITWKFISENDLVIIPVIQDAIKINKKIKSFILNRISIAENYNITKNFCECLIANKSITHLDISNCELGIETRNFVFLKDMLAKNNTLKSLFIRNNCIGIYPENIRLLVDGLKANKSIEKLDMSENNNDSSEEISAVFQNYLCCTRKLKELIFENFKLPTKNTVKYLTNGIKCNMSLTTLRLGNIGVYSFDFLDHLGNALKYCCVNIENLSLKQSEKMLSSFKHFNLESFSAGLAKCKNLQMLDICGLELGKRGKDLRCLAEALKELKNLIKLDLSFNFLGADNKNGESIIDALSNCKKLSKLNLSRNYLGASKRCFSALMNSIEKLDCITEISLSHNPIKDQVLSLMDPFTKILNNKKKLTNLDYSNNSNWDINEFMKKFAKGIENNKTIKILDLSSSIRTLDNFIDLASLIKNNNTIEVLIIDHIRISSLEEMVYLCDGLKANTRITELRMNWLGALWTTHNEEFNQEFYNFLSVNEVINTIELQNGFLSGKHYFFKSFCECLKLNKRLVNINIVNDYLLNDSRNLDEIEMLLDVNKIIKKFSIIHDKLERNLYSLKKLRSLVQKFPLVSFGYDHEYLRNNDYNDSNLRYQMFKHQTNNTN